MEIRVGASAGIRGRCSYLWRSRNEITDTPNRNSPTKILHPVLRGSLRRKGQQEARDMALEPHRRSVQLDYFKPKGPTRVERAETTYCKEKAHNNRPHDEISCSQRNYEITTDKRRRVITLIKARCQHASRLCNRRSREERPCSDELTSIVAHDLAVALWGLAWLFSVEAE